MDREREAADIEAGTRPRGSISYNWTSQEHRDRVKSWVDRLIADGVDVVFDRYDLKEGSDKFMDMERMVVDPSVTHVLVFSDREYARKADDRSDGVSVDSQFISEEVYRRVERSTSRPTRRSTTTGNGWCGFCMGAVAREAPRLGLGRATWTSTTTAASPCRASYAGHVRH